MNSLLFDFLKIVNLGFIEYASIFLVATALAFSVYAIFKRLLSAPRWYKYSLVMLHLIIFIAVMGLIFQPKIRSSEPLKVRLVTSLNWNAIKSTDFPSYLLLDENNRSNELFNSYYSNKILHLPDQLLLKHSNVNEIEIMGDGLTEAQWQHFPNVKVSYHVPNIKQGIIYPYWNSSFNLGENLDFSGQFQTNSKGVYRARLLSPADDVVAEISIDTVQPFKLSARPKLAGQHQYRVQVLNNEKKIISEELLNVHVTEKSSAKILVLQSSPSFETKQLQNWAAENGAQFLVRSQVSKNHFTTRSTNIPKGTTKINFNNKLNHQIFDQFDLVIVDGRGLVNMSNSEQTELNISVSNGLGLLVLVDQVLLKLSKNNSFDLLKDLTFTSLQQEQAVIPYLVNHNLSREPVSDDFIPLVAQAISSIDPQVKFSSLVENSKGHILVANQSINSGSISVSLLQETHKLVTSGKKTNYSKLWQHLIGRTARRTTQEQLYVNIPGQLVFQNQLTKICYHDIDIQKPEKLLIEHEDAESISTQEVLLQKNVFIDSQSCGYFWPKKSGWYAASFSENSEITKSFYVSERNKWQAHQQKDRIKATLAKQSNFHGRAETTIHYKAINQWLFWWLFFICVSLIWVERKFL